MSVLMTIPGELLPRSDDARVSRPDKHVRPTRPPVDDKFQLMLSHANGAASLGSYPIVFRECISDV
jgi:hypothetical protein